LFIERRRSGASARIVSARTEARAGSRRRHRIAAAGSAGARDRHTFSPMTILVDELREYPGVALPFTSWCHMATDGRFEDLHAFAAQLGLRRAWFQGDHYDLPPHGRARAVALGAEEVATEELLARMTGPRGDRARRRVLVPRGRAWLAGDDGPRVLRYPPATSWLSAARPVRASRRWPRVQRTAIARRCSTRRHPGGNGRRRAVA
jgi:hypothetical protein